MVKPLVLLPPLAFAGMAALFWWGMQRQDPEQLPSAFVGKEAPQVTLAQLGDNAPFTQTDLRDGQIKLVNFWASWCAPCRVEHPQLESLADDGIEIFGVNYKDNPEKALGFLAEMGNPFAKAGADAQGKMATDWGVYGVPETFVVGRDGAIAYKLIGPITPDNLNGVLKAAIAKALAAQ